MKRKSVIVASIAWASLVGAAGAMTLDEFFELKIRPTLMNSCFTCHGGEKTSGGLRVDAREHLMSGGERGAAIMPGDVIAEVEV